MHNLYFAEFILYRIMQTHWASNGWAGFTSWIH